MPGWGERNIGVVSTNLTKSSNIPALRHVFVSSIPGRCNIFSDMITQQNGLKPRPHQQQCRSNIVKCYKSNDSFHKVERCFDIVAEKDEIYEKLLRHCCERQQCWSNVRHCRSNIQLCRSTCSIRNVVSTLLFRHCCRWGRGFTVTQIQWIQVDKRTGLPSSTGSTPKAQTPKNKLANRTNSLNEQDSVADGRLRPGAATWRTRPNNVIWRPTGASAWLTGRNIWVMFDCGYSLHHLFPVLWMT